MSKASAESEHDYVGRRVKIHAQKTLFLPHTSFTSCYFVEHARMRSASCTVRCDDQDIYSTGCDLRLPWEDITL